MRAQRSVACFQEIDFHKKKLKDMKPFIKDQAILDELNKLFNSFSAKSNVVIDRADTTKFESLAADLYNKTGSNLVLRTEKMRALHEKFFDRIDGGKVQTHLWKMVSDIQAAKAAPPATKAAVAKSKSGWGK